MARVSRRPLPAADILDIWDYIAEDSLDEADRWVDRLDEKLDLLATQPLMGRARDELLAGLRSFPFGGTSSSTWRWRMGSMWCGCCTVVATLIWLSAKTTSDA